jgi:cytochrome o ubiquinol oxidase subunit 1
MGSSADVNAFFGISTMIIAVPTGVKVFDWLFTMYRGRIRFHPAMLWSIGFIVTFVIGGVSGVLLAIPPADFLMHNSTFLVAHFHNMIIPGVLFGYVAGFVYWFPKAIGFKLEPWWGKVSFWCWLIGFYLAFMPLYVLGFLGMPRRMEQYDVAEWQPYLVVAAVGALVILFGIVAMVLQLAVSIRRWRENRDLSGDPWDGRTLEWLTASPPAAYNFATLPRVEAVDAFYEMKKRGAAYGPPAQYQDIFVPKSTGIGPILGGLAFLLAFAMVWQIWWLAAACGLAILSAVILRTFADDTEYCIPAAEVAAIEARRFEALAQTTEPERVNTDPYFTAQMLPGRVQ